MSYPDGVTLAAASCPLGCAADSSPVVRGRDRLMGIAGEFQVVRCASCGLLRTDPRPTLESMGHYYPEDYGPYQSTRIQPAPRPGFWRRLLGPWMNSGAWDLPPLSPGRLLELGCASGSFMERMRKLGWSVEGLEFSRKAADQARAAGHRVHVGTVESATEVAGPFDLVVGWMFFEHLHDPVRSLRILRDWTAPRGWLALSVPDAGSWEFRHFRSRWYALHLPHHLSHFTPETLTKVLDRAGWRTHRISWQKNPNNTLYSLGYGWADRGMNVLAKVANDIADARRFRIAQLALGALFGMFRWSGRLTVWARRA